MSLQSAERDLLRFVTAGSVDDGKSTLIGRLLYDCNGIYDDQLSSVRRVSLLKNTELDLSLLTDGLRPEREQGITIDVAYRYFSTPRRKFIIADTPGHEEYTRNMATGASTAQLAVILADARKGVLSQTRRHVLIAWLIGIRQMIVGVNKMDLVDYNQQVFRSIRDEFINFAKPLHAVQFYFVPLSALLGYNVVTLSDRMAWYEGQSMLRLLETVPAQPVWDSALRFPVQCVIRPHQDFRGYAGQVSSGVLKPGQAVLALPSGQRTRVKDIFLHTRILEEARPPLSIVLTTTEHIDLGRGDMLVSPDQVPAISWSVVAHLVWTSHKPLRKDTRYLIKHTTKVLCGRVSQLKAKIDINNNFEKLPSDALQFNEIGEVQIDLESPIFCDPYEYNHSTGNFIVVDPFSNDTVAAGMISHAIPAHVGDIFDGALCPSCVGRQHGVTVWFTGLSAAGKTTICKAVASELLAHGLQVEVIDGDIIRQFLCEDLGFSKHDRNENIRRISFVSQLLTRNGTIVLVSVISPYRAARDEARRKIGDFIEVFVSTPLTVCEMRDPKELYKKARSGEIREFTGVDDPYEPPLAPEIVCDTDQESTRESSSRVVAFVLNYLHRRPSEDEVLAKVATSLS